MALRDSLYLFIMNYTKLEDCLFLLRDCLTCLSGISVLVFYAFIFVLEITKNFGIYQDTKIV